MTTTLDITGTATNTSGVASQFTGTITITDPVVQPPVISKVDVTPDPAPPNTLRTITINATDPQGQALSYTCKVNGANATPVAGQPNKFTYTA